MIHMKYMHFSLKNYLALNFQKVYYPPPQAWHAVKHAFKLLWIFTVTFGLLVLQLSTPVLIRRLLFLWHKLTRAREQIKQHVPVLASNCASAHKLSPLIFSLSLHLCIQRSLGRHPKVPGMSLYMVRNADVSLRGQRCWDPSIPVTSCDWGSTVHGNNPITPGATQDLKEEQSRSEVKAKFGPLILKWVYAFMPQIL